MPPRRLHAVALLGSLPLVGVAACQVGLGLGLGAPYGDAVLGGHATTVDGVLAPPYRWAATGQAALLLAMAWLLLDRGGVVRVPGLSQRGLRTPRLPHGHGDALSRARPKPGGPHRLITAVQPELVSMAFPSRRSESDGSNGNLQAVRCRGSASGPGRSRLKFPEFALRDVRSRFEDGQRPSRRSRDLQRDSVASAGAARCCRQAG